ncbi:hypothetical protein A3860_32410 [Niastella vici]|uniref:Fibronectin type-III domain-containing protein n=1 Tax=Niastella vici TaxID=1703345 RepID=A0A1V9FQS4_9BACT|nr:fibronectin type III domain-containing protein [Niastella vici]OQP60704.1 hypothetical protein A3860_32410 [Niastella vici]
MNRIITKYKKYQHDIPITSRRVIMQMEEHKELFPNPPEALEKLKILLPEYEQSLADARGRDKQMVANKDKLKAIAVDLLQELADYVTVTSKGDRTMLLSSGFDVNSENGNSNKQPPVIEKLQIDTSKPGEATIRVKNVTNAIAFVHQYTTEPPGQHTIWTSEYSSLGGYTFKGLSSDKRYWFRVIAIGYYGLNGYSPVESRVIQ